MIKLQPNSSRKKRGGERAQTDKIRSEKEVESEIQKILKEYFKQPYANKMENLEEMDKFLERHDLPTMNQEEI